MSVKPKQPHLRVSGDGTAVEYYNFGYLDATKEVPVADRLTAKAMEKAGREFIEKQLGEFIKLAPNEELAPLHTRFQLQAAATADGAKVESDTVLANEITFGRKIDGFHVVGAGSKIQLIFDNQGDVVGFAFDWPHYKTADMQSTTSIDQIEQRMEGAPHALDDSAVTVERMECGLFDPGIRMRPSTEPVQSGCIYMTTKTEGDVTSAIATAVPAGETVLPDEYWPEARMLCTGASYCGTALPAAPTPDTP